MTDRQTSELETQLCFAVYSASLAFTRAYRPYLKALNLTYPQYLIMQVLWETDGLTVGEVGARMMQDSGTITPLVKRLEQAGLLKRRRSAIDERLVHIDLTDKGTALAQAGRAIPDAVRAAVGPRFATDRQFLDTLIALRGVLEEIAADGMASD